MGVFIVRVADRVETGMAAGVNKCASVERGARIECMTVTVVRLHECLRPASELSMVSKYTSTNPTSFGPSEHSHIGTSKLAFTSTVTVTHQRVLVRLRFQPLQGDAAMSQSALEEPPL